MNRNYHNDHWPYMEHAGRLPGGQTAAAALNWFRIMRTTRATSVTCPRALPTGMRLLIDPACGDRIELWLLIEDGRDF